MRNWKPHFRAIAAVAALALASHAPSALAQDQTADSQAGEAPKPATIPLPDPGAPDGAVATARSEYPYDRYELPIGPYGPGAVRSRTVEGHVLWSAFRLSGTEATTAQIIEGYRQRLAEQEFEPLLDCATKGCGGFDFRFAVQLLPPPAMLMDTADFAQFTATRGDEDAQSFVSVLVSRLLGAIHIQTVVVVPAPGAAALEPAPAAAEGTSPAAPPPVPVPVQDRDGLLIQLTTEGHVPVRGLSFETGGATLTAESGPALDALALLLTENPGLSVAIVGHSDNEGGLDINLTLSKRRAEAVRDALIARGVAADRLDAHGVGFLAPVSSNATEEGRARNRRVELILR